MKGSEHLKICGYLKGKGSRVKAFDEPNPIYEAIMPLRLLVLKINDPEWYALVVNFMDHKEQRKVYPEYWQVGFLIIT